MRVKGTVTFLDPTGCNDTGELGFFRLTAFLPLPPPEGGMELCHSRCHRD